MENVKDKSQTASAENNFSGTSLQRRAFLQYAGAGAAAMALVAIGCKKDHDNDTIDYTTIDFASDLGVLNYAYALEQLEAAFYIKVAANPPSAFTATQKSYFQDVQYHEIAHREFFKNVLGKSAIGNLEVDFSSINFGDAQSVLATAQAFEDLGVAAYNGAGVRIKNDAYLVAAGQIVSVEARHAAWVRDQISNGSFADLASLTSSGANVGGGLDAALTPDKVLQVAGKYIKTKINVVNL